MQLSMKAKSFTFSDKFTIWDEDGNDKYYVVGSMFGCCWYAAGCSGAG